MKNKTAFALTAAMTLSFCTNSQASMLADKIRAMAASQAATTFGSSSSSSSSAFIQALKNYDPSTGSSSSLVSKSQVSSSSGSASSLSSLLDQRIAAATLQAQAAAAKATAVNFSSGEYIPTRNVDGYSVTASGVKATPTVNPSASAATATLVNKVKIQSASAQQQAQVAAAQQKAQVAAAQQQAQQKYAALSDYDALMNSKWGNIISDVQSGSGSASLIKMVNSDYNSIMNMGNDVIKTILVSQSGSGSASLIKMVNSDYGSIANMGDAAKKYQAVISSTLSKSATTARANLTVSAAQKAISAIQQGKSAAAYIKTLQALGNIKSPRPISVPTPLQKMTPYFLSDYGLKDFSQISYRAIRYLTK